MTTPKAGVLKRLDGDFIMFDSGITIKELINDIMDETDIALPVPINNIVNIYDGFMQKLYRTIVRHTDEYKIYDNYSNTLPYTFSEFNAYDIYKIYDSNTRMEEVIHVSNDTYNAIKGTKEIYTVLNNRQILIDGGAFISIGAPTVIYNGDFDAADSTKLNQYIVPEGFELALNSSIPQTKYFQVSDEDSYSNKYSLKIVKYDNTLDRTEILNQSINSWYGEYVFSFKMKGKPFNNIKLYMVVNNDIELFGTKQLSNPEKYMTELDNGWYEYRCLYTGEPKSFYLRVDAAKDNYYIDDIKLEEKRYHIYYYKTPPRTECDDSGVVSDNTVPVPLAFIDMVKAKMRAELYLLVNETGLASNWIAQYNKLLEDFKAFCESARPSIM